MQDNTNGRSGSLGPAQPAGLIALGLVAVGFALRVHHLAGQSLWYDEAFSVFLAGMAPGEIIARTAADIHPPLYYFLLHAWMLAAGSSEFAVRFLSLLFGVLAIPLFYQASRRLLAVLPGGGTPLAGLVATGIAAIIPFYIWYSQEARMYTLLTFLGLLSSVLLLSLLGRDATGQRFRLLGWTATGIAAVYTHFYGFFLLAFQLLYVLWRSIADPRVRGESVRILVGACGVFVAYLPWLSITFARFGADASYWEGILAPGEMLNKTFLAFTAGLTATSAEQSVIATGYGILVALGLVAGTWVALRDRTSRGSCSLVIFPLLYALIPLVLLYAVSFERPKFDPRYLMLASPGFYLLAALAPELLARRGFSREPGRLRTLSRSLLAAGLVFVAAAAALPLRHNFANEVLARDDFRSVAGWVRDRIQPDEAIILCSGHMFPAFSYYFDYPDLIRIPDQPTLSTKELVTFAVADELNHRLAGKAGVWLVLWQDNVVDPDAILTTMLHDQGILQPIQQSFWGIRLLHFALPAQARFSREPGVQAPLGLVFGDAVRLTGYRPAALTAPAGDSLDLTLFWEPIRVLSADYRLVLRVVDNLGNEWGRFEGRPAAYEHPTMRWQPGATVPGRIELPILAGTPPGEYRLRVSMYPADAPQRLEIQTPDGHALGQEHEIGLVRVARGAISTATDAPGPPVKTPVRALLAPQVQLVGHDFAGSQALPGDALHGTLVWRALEQPPADFALQLRLVNSAGQVASQRALAPAGHGYPTTRWQPGEFVRGQVSFVMAYDTPPGDWQLQAALTAGGAAAGPAVTLAEVHVNARPAPPPPAPAEHPVDQSLGADIALKGFSARRSGTTVSVTLYWVGLRPMDTQYQVFVHLLDSSGSIVAQHDGVPDRGGWPTSAWPPGSLITDEHVLTLPATAGPGPFELAVGAYAAVSGQRLPVAGSADGRVLLGPLMLP